MHAYVFTDAALARDAGRFVWLSVDTEKPENAAFLERYPVEAWPSLYVIDPKTGEVVLRWLGSLTVPQLQAFLDQVARGDDPRAEARARALPEFITLPPGGAAAAVKAAVEARLAAESPAD